MENKLNTQIKVRNARKTIEGIVTSTSMNKTITLSVERRVKHPIYKKFLKLTSKFYAHDEKNECNIGDKVLVMETKPLSKTKCWRLVSILVKAK